MRHVWSLIAGVVATLLAWLLLATGQLGWQEVVTDAGALRAVDLVGPLLVLVAAGVVLGLIGTLRFSPVGPIVAGVLLLLPAVLLLADPVATLDRLPDPWRVLGQDFAPALPLENGTLPVLGALLLMATFSIQRWRRWPAVAGAPTADSGPAQAAVTDEAAPPDGDATAETTEVSEPAAQTTPEATADETATADDTAAADRTAESTAGEPGTDTVAGPEQADQESPSTERDEKPSAGNA